MVFNFHHLKVYYVAGKKWSSGKYNPNFIYHHYHKLIQLRKAYAAIVDGGYKIYSIYDQQLYVYIRSLAIEVILVINNFYVNPYEFIALKSLQEHRLLSCILNNYPLFLDSWQRFVLESYQSIVLYFQPTIN